VQLSPEFDDKGIAADPLRVNDFDFDSPGSQNADLRCPMAAHIRKTNPRSDIGSRGPNGVVNQFRILRRGIPYVSRSLKQIPELQPQTDTHSQSQGNELDADPKGKRGLLFVCYQSTISEGFAFIQGQWANQRNFVKPGVGLDAVLGQLSHDEQVSTTGMFPQDSKRPITLNAVSPFVIPKGGEYFFTPSIAALTGILADVKGERSRF
jgi:Dyp-type peroxidase family